MSAKLIGIHSVAVQQKLMRHAHVSTTMAKRKANRPIVQRLLRRPANQQVSPIFRAVEPVRAAARSVVYVFLVNADLQQRPKIKVPSVE